MSSTISCKKFTQNLVDQTPIYADLILEDKRPMDGFAQGYFETGSWDAYDGVEQRLDRFNSVFPNLTSKWNRVSDPTGCIGTPCDPAENRIGFGNTRVEYFLEKQNWATDLFCFDEIMHVTKARENFSYIISDILRPAANIITSNFLRKRAAQEAGAKWLADATMTPFTYSWEAGSDTYITTSAEPTSKLTPQMLQRRVQRLASLGYFGKNLKGAPMMLDLCTDTETLWNMNRNVNAADTNSILNHWRYTEFDSKSLEEYWKYGWSGQIGNYMVSVDYFPLRFNKVSANRFQVVYPYTNGAADNGIKSNYNTDFDTAQYQFSLIRHRRAIKILSFNASPVNPEMPFLIRDFAGKPRFVMDNLGADVNGCVIENKRRNKGQFIMDFEMAVQPAYVEFMELIFHKREPACIVIEEPCNDPVYPAPDQDYSSSNAGCPDTATLYFTPLENEAGNYVVAVDTISCNGVPQNHTAISSADLAQLVLDLAIAMDPDLGSWTVVGDGVQIQLADSTCSAVVIPWVV